MNKRLPLSVGTVLQSRYAIVGQLGHGGMGAVYEAKDNRTSATVALKETYADDDYMRNAFEREAKMLANMTHEAFPRVMDYFAEDDGFYLVMELIRGKDLSELLEERNAPFETEQVLEWADQILDALEDLHSQDIVHRDIKPSNLKLTPRGRIKLLDFGIAKGAAGDMTALQSTVGSMAAATLQYAPLEQVLRADTNWFQMLCVNFSDKTLNILDHGTDARSDLYALGATLYHLLTNTLPINAPTRALSIWTGQSDKLRPAHEINPKVSPVFSAALQKALEIDRNKRLNSAIEMRKMLSNDDPDKDEETVVMADEKTLPLSIQSAFLNAKPNEVETEILNHDSTTDFYEAVDSSEKETVARVLPPKVNTVREKDKDSSVTRFRIFATVLMVVFVLSLGFVFYSSSITYENGSKDNSSNSQNGNSSISTTNIPAQGKVSKNSIGMEFVEVPTGTASVGSADGDSDERPIHSGWIREGLLIGKYEVTQEQWQGVMGNNPSNFKNCPKCPVEQVSWDDAQAFLIKLNAKDDGFHYQLPTEAEWEYAARAETTGDYYGDLDSIAWYESNSGVRTHPVGQKQPNRFGLYDMSGNVSEWCQDGYGSYTSVSAQLEPKAVSNGQGRVVRGGSWSDKAFKVRSACRDKASSSFSNLTIGSRVAARPK